MVNRPPVSSSGTTVAMNPHNNPAPFNPVNKEGGVMNPTHGDMSKLPPSWIPIADKVPAEILDLFGRAWQKNPDAVKTLLRSINEHPNPPKPTP